MTEPDIVGYRGTAVWQVDAEHVRADVTRLFGGEVTLSQGPMTMTYSAADARALGLALVAASEWKGTDE